MPLKVSISSVEWCFFTRYGRKVDFSRLLFHRVQKSFVFFSIFNSFDLEIQFFNNNSWIKSSLRVQIPINRLKRGFFRKILEKKKIQNFSNFLKKSQGSPYEIFRFKVTLDIKMSNSWLYINHQYMTKYCVFTVGELKDLTLHRANVVKLP